MPGFAQALNDATRAIDSSAPPYQWLAPSTPAPSPPRHALDVSAGSDDDNGASQDTPAPDNPTADASNNDTPAADDQPLDEAEKNDCQKALDEWIPKYTKSLQKFLRDPMKGYRVFRSFMSAENYASNTGKQTKNFARRCWKYGQDQLSQIPNQALGESDQ